ncbi:MAG: beta-N-acetylhexosaminidase [Alphaproteobacteria bacterium]|nr:beta-N-acetylhexosaminidase [Alphaproteobacteria bacterium]
MSRPLAVIFGCAGTTLSPAESAFFTRSKPLGFSLYKRNCETPEQTRALVDALRACVGRADAPVLIDQEGGRVARLKPPHWRIGPSGAALGAIARRDRAAGVEATYLHYRLIAADLAPLGIDVNCAPVLDVAQAGMTAAIGDRAFSDDPMIVTELGLAACAGLLAGGVMPVIKHMPGHGRAGVDSHMELPRVAATEAELLRADYAPFIAAAGMPWGMTAHIVYPVLDPSAPGTTSKIVIERVIRGVIGFAGFLVSDDITMKALSGTAAERAVASLSAGCDAALHCSGEMAEMETIAEVVPSLTPAAVRRLERARALVPARTAGALPAEDSAARLYQLLARAA